jgi:hypothetical protein
MDNDVNWKPDHRGEPRRMPADYIIKRDRDARRAYVAMRTRGMSHEDAEGEIETAFDKCFREMLATDRDRRLEAWTALAQGMPAAGLFP